MSRRRSELHAPGLLPAVLVSGTAPPAVSLIWLHGLGADGYDFADTVPQFVLADRPDVRYLFPHAPVQPVTLNGGMAMRSWYDILGLDASAPQDAEGIQRAAGWIRALVAHEREQGVADSRIFLAGFSQGGALALYTGLTHDSTLGGVIALSTYLPLRQQLLARRDGLRKPPVFLAHGDRDPVVAPALGERARQALAALDVAVDWHLYAGMEHSVCLEELQDIHAWLAARL